MLHHDNFTVKLSALRIIGNIFIQTFCVALNQRDRSFQLVWYVIQKFFTHFINLDLIFNILLQFVICRFLVQNRTFQFSGHLVEIITKHINLISRPTLISCLKIKVRHLFWHFVSSLIGRVIRLVTTRMINPLITTMIAPTTKIKLLEIATLFFYTSSGERIRK